MQDFRVTAALLWLAAILPMLVFEFVPKSQHLGGHSGVVPFVLANVLGLPLVYYIRARATRKFVSFVLTGVFVGLIPCCFYLLLDHAYGGETPYSTMAQIGVVVGALAGLAISLLFKSAPWQQENA